MTTAGRWYTDRQASGDIVDVGNLGVSLLQGWGGYFACLSDHVDVFIWEQLMDTAVIPRAGACTET